MSEKKISIRTEASGDVEVKAGLVINEGLQVLSCAKNLKGGDCGYMGGSVCPKCGAVPTREKALETDVEAKDADTGIETTAITPDLFKDARDHRLETLGIKSAEPDSYVCNQQRKVFPGAAEPCATCPGGCAPESGLPTILAIEGIAEKMFAEAEVVASGYSNQNDLYLVDLRKKDGKYVETIFDGTTGECVSWRNIGEIPMSEKSAEDVKIIGIEDAAEIALKAFDDGEVMAVEADVTDDGIDVWVVEVDTKSGESYDVYVNLVGEVIEQTKWSPDGASEKVAPPMEEDDEEEDDEESEEETGEEEMDEEEMDEEKTPKEKSVETITDDKFLAELAEFELLSLEVE
jgi:hypothetical protein